MLIRFFYQDFSSFSWLLTYTFLIPAVNVHTFNPTTELAQLKESTGIMKQTNDANAEIKPQTQPIFSV